MPHTQPIAPSKQGRTRQKGRGGRASGQQIDALTLLKRDHDEVKAMFKQFEELEEDGEREALAALICKRLTAHALCEEEYLYPAAHEYFADDEEEANLVHEAEVEHAAAKDLIASIENMDAGDEKFGPTVKVLGEYVSHHVREEEQELFPKLRRSSIDLEEMGRNIAEQMTRLASKMNLGEEDEDENQRSRRASGNSSPSRSRGRSGSARSRKRN